MAEELGYIIGVSYIDTTKTDSYLSGNVNISASSTISNSTSSNIRILFAATSTISNETDSVISATGNMGASSTISNSASSTLGGTILLAAASTIVNSVSSNIIGGSRVKSISVITNSTSSVIYGGSRVKAISNISFSSPTAKTYASANIHAQVIPTFATLCKISAKTYSKVISNPAFATGAVIAANGTLKAVNTIVFGTTTILAATVPIKGTSSIVFDTNSEIITSSVTRAKADIKFSTETSLVASGRLRSSSNIIFSPAVSLIYSEIRAKALSTAQFFVLAKETGKILSRSQSNITFSSNSILRQIVNGKANSLVVFGSYGVISSSLGYIKSSANIVFNAVSKSTILVNARATSDIVFDTDSQIITETTNRAKSNIIFSTNSVLSSQSYITAESSVVFDAVGNFKTGYSYKNKVIGIAFPQRVGGILNSSIFSVANMVDIVNTYFIITVKTDNTGTSASNQFTIPTTGVGYNYSVVTSEQSLVAQTGDVTLEWDVAGTYEIRISGSFPRIYFNNTGDKSKLLTVENWGDLLWTSMENAFFGCNNLQINTDTTPLLTGVSSMASMFNGCSSLDYPIGGWNVSNITDMSSLFEGCTIFNQSLMDWVVDNVTTMSNMFLGASSFNQDISGWNVSNVAYMGSMFYNAVAFDRNIGEWDVINVVDFTNFMFGKTDLTFGLANMDAIYNGWSLLTLTPNITISFGSAQYSNAAIDGRALLTDAPNSWNITDGGLNAISAPMRAASSVVFDTASEFSGSLGEIATSSSIVFSADAVCEAEDLLSFIITVKTNNTGTSLSNQFTIPTTGAGYNYDVITSEQSLTGQTGNVTLTWATAGTYQVKISGTFPRIYFNNTGDKSKLVTIEQWGTIVWSSMVNSFYGCNNLVLNAIDAPNLSSIVSTRSMFLNCVSLNSSLNSWDVSTVTNISNMFLGATLFNGNISSWDVSSVTDMNSMFSGASSFNQDISGWNVGNVLNMGGMFLGATIFNQDISGWNVGSVTAMNLMFYNAVAFNQNIGSWNISNVTDFTNFMLGKTPTTFSATNLDAIYNGWSLRPVLSGKSISFGTAKYTSAGSAGRAILTGAPNNWSITDGGI